MSGTERRGPVVESIATLAELRERIPAAEGVPTGVPGLDELFFVPEWRDGRLHRRPLGGIPRHAVLQVTGVADTGKSLLVEQYAVTRAAAGETVAFVTMESPAPFTAMGLRTRATALGLDRAAVERRVVLLDGATHTVLARDLAALLDTLAFAIRTHRVCHVVLDSLTGLFEAREMLARDVVRPLFGFLKTWHQTALLVSQKRSGHEALTAEAAGGYAVAHILDGSLVLAKHPVLSPQAARLHRVPLGETVRLFRIDGCRLAGHDTRTHHCEIGPDGILRIGPPLTRTVAGGEEEAS